MMLERGTENERKSSFKKAIKISGNNEILEKQMRILFSSAAAAADEEEAATRSAASNIYGRP